MIFLEKKEIIYGIHTVRTVLNHNPERLIKIYSLINTKSKNLKSLIHKMKSLGLKIKRINRKDLDKRSFGGVHQGILAYVKKKIESNEDYLSRLLDYKNRLFLFLILDKITDPRNFGACLRCADAAGVDGVITLKYGSAKLSSIAKKSSSGATETVPIIFSVNLSRTIHILRKKNVWIIGTSDNAIHNLYESNLNRSIAFIMGSESTGIRNIIKNNCDEIVYIPMFGHVSSLNVSVASGICLFEAIRQRQSANK